MHDLTPTRHRLAGFAGMDVDLTIDTAEPVYSLRFGNRHYDGRPDHIHWAHPRSFSTREELAVWGTRPTDNPQPCGA